MKRLAILGLQKKLSSAYTGGAIGALVDSFDIWIIGKAGITSLLGIGLQPEFIRHRLGKICSNEFRYKFKSVFSFPV